jgi:hypothetical protein
MVGLTRFRRLNMVTRIAKINGHMTKREIVRQMAERAMADESSPVMAVSYVARRIGYTVPQAYNFLRAVNRLGIVELGFSKKSVVFATN